MRVKVDTTLEDKKGMARCFELLVRKWAKKEGMPKDELQIDLKNTGTLVEHNLDEFLIAEKGMPKGKFNTKNKRVSKKAQKLYKAFLVLKKHKKVKDLDGFLKLHT